ncbi:MAG: 6-carboxytetrahydropterin synthase QueD [Elusimicrobia bacterium RIFCSPLOWO2_01_FULL_60_11]|nr:MAG: 6-carboxytetrahydropterin synthase QueD [Elusimicrobia bacterium RIFCSPLOWO2_01_FULL_60_11]
MYSVTKTISFCYGHRLLNYQGKCKHLHGHNGRVEIFLSAKKLDKRGMVVDFGDVKTIVKGFVDDNLDHKMILCEKDTIVPVLRARRELYYLMKENPTAENIAKHIFDFARGKKLPVIRVRLWETDTSFAEYSG